MNTAVSRITAFIYKKPSYKYWSLLILVLFILIAIKISKGFDKGTDWNVFYQAGINFTDNVSLYSRIGGAERYIYPPFAAMLFQVFQVFSMKVAGGVWIFFNWLMWLGTIYLIVRILEIFKVEKKAIKTALLLGLLFSVRFVWYHAMFAQMNMLVLFLSLWAFLLYLEGREWGVAICLGIAISIKILPVVLLGWFISKSGFRLAFKSSVVLVVCTLLPMIFRGYDLWLNDLKEYYITFIEPFKEGRVEPNFQNYSLSAAIYKVLMPTTGENNPLNYHYNLWETTAETARTIYKISAATALAIFAAVVAYTRFISKKVSLYEVSFILLFTHLISGITWEYHLVSLLFAETLFFLQLKKSDALYVKVLHGLLIAFMLLNAIIGLDTVGQKLFYLSCGYSFPTVLMLLLMLHALKNIFWLEVASLSLKEIPVASRQDAQHTKMP